MMRTITSIRSFAIGAAAVLGFAASALSQGMMRPPHVPGEFKPVVGSGAEYLMTMKGGTTQTFAMAVVGKESVDGQEGYWLEWRMDSPHGKMVMKQLMVPGTAAIKRMIVQTPGRPPMEMPVSMMNMGMGMHHQHEAAPEGGDHGMGQMLGSESVTVPAGTFNAEHFRSADNGHTADVWAATKVSPYGLVKMTSSDGTSMVLQKVLQNETSQITGEPQKIPGMPGMPN